MSEGFYGMIDFAGYPTGQGVPSTVNPPCGGLHGLLDFVGYPCGGLGGARAGHAPGVGGKHLYRAAMRMAMEQKYLEMNKEASRQAKEQTARRLAVRYLQREAELRQNLRTNTINAVILAEV